MMYTSIRRQLVTGFCILGLSFAPTPTRATGDTFKRSAELGKRTAKTSDDVDTLPNSTKPSRPSRRSVKPRARI
jgi:hypothetical protein